MSHENKPENTIRGAIAEQIQKNPAGAALTGLFLAAVIFNGIRVESETNIVLDCKPTQSNNDTYIFTCK